MPPTLEYVMTPNRPAYLPAESTVIKIAEVHRDGERFAGLYYGASTDTYHVVFSYRTAAIYDTEPPYSRLVPAMGQEISMVLRPAYLNEMVSKMANLEFRCI